MLDLVQEKKCYGFKKITIVSSKYRIAKWTGSRKVVLKQFLVSIKSHLSFAAKKKHLRDSATKDYFTEIYSWREDPLLFDGKNYDYLDQIKNICNLEELNNGSILDIGCGNATLFHWLKSNNIQVEKYLGIDFAHSNEEIETNVKIVQSDINYIDKNTFNEATHIFFINVMCYLEDATVKNILSHVKSSCRIFIIEPIPNIFWDAHFEGVKLYYRTENQVKSTLLENKFKVLKLSNDYLFSIFKTPFFKLTYSIVASN